MLVINLLDASSVPIDSKFVVICYPPNVSIYIYTFSRIDAY